MSAEAVQGHTKTTWVERALTDGWATGWSRSPLLWAPRAVTWPRRRILTTALLVLGPGLLLTAVAAAVTGVHPFQVDAGHLQRLVKENLLALAFALAFAFFALVWAMPILVVATIGRVLRGRRAGEGIERTAPRGGIRCGASGGTRGARWRPHLCFGRRAPPHRTAWFRG